MPINPMQFSVAPGRSVRMKNAPQNARRWPTETLSYEVPVGELGSVVEDGKSYLKVKWPQIPYPVFTRKIDLELVE